MDVRKIRLCCAAFCRSVWPLLVDDRYRKALLELEGDPDRTFRTRRKGFLRGHLFNLQFEAVDLSRDPSRLVECWRASAIYEAGMAAWNSIADTEDEEARKRPVSVWDLSTSKAVSTVERHVLAALKFDALSRSVHPGKATREAKTHLRGLKECVLHEGRVRFDPSWLTETVRALVVGIHSRRTFHRMPILADAIQEAGCEDPELLEHCRAPGPHARGCWVIDGILRKG